MLRLEDIEVRPGDYILPRYTRNKDKVLVTGVPIDNGGSNSLSRSIIIKVDKGWSYSENKGMQREMNVPERFRKMQLWCVVLSEYEPIPTFPYRMKSNDKEKT